MEKLKFLRKSILSAMNDYAQYLDGSNLPKVAYSILGDERHDKYQLLAVGWDKNDRIYHIVFHADIVGGHIWIQEDNTEDGFANLLLEQGVDKKDVVLAYYPEHHRQFTEFAVA